MADFFAFGKENFLRPRNIINHLEDSEYTANIRGWCYYVYRKILAVQMNEASNHIDAFKTLVRDWKSLEEPLLIEEAEEKMELCRSRIRNALSEMKELDYSKTLNHAAKADTIKNQRLKKIIRQKLIKLFFFALNLRELCQNLQLIPSLIANTL